MRRGRADRSSRSHAARIRSTTRRPVQFGCGHGANHRGVRTPAAASDPGTCRPARTGEGSRSKKLPTSRRRPTPRPMSCFWFGRKGFSVTISLRMLCVASRSTTAMNWSIGIGSSISPVKRSPPSKTGTRTAQRCLGLKWAAIGPARTPGRLSYLSGPGNNGNFQRLELRGTSWDWRPWRTAGHGAFSIAREPACQDHQAREAQASASLDRTGLNYQEPEPPDFRAKQPAEAEMAAETLSP